MTTPAAKGHFTILDGFPSDVLAIEAHGRIDHDSYTTELIPAIQAKIAAEGKVKLFYRIGSEFSGYTMGAAMEDAKVGFLHLADFARVAFVSDVEWMNLAVKLFAPMIPCPVRVFSEAETAAAKAWIVATDEPKGGPEVAADHKLLPLEDRMPPAD